MALSHKSVCLHCRYCKHISMGHVPRHMLSWHERFEGHKGQPRKKSGRHDSPLVDATFESCADSGCNPPIARLHHHGGVLASHRKLNEQWAGYSCSFFVSAIGEKMHINGTRKIINKLNELFSLETQNEAIKTAIIDPIDDGIIFKDIYKIDRMAVEFQQQKINSGTYITLNEAKMVIMLSSLISDNKEDDMPLPDLFFDALFESAKFFEKSVLMKDPYLTHMQFDHDQTKQTDLTVKTTKLSKYSPFFYSGPEMYEPGYSIPRIGFVDKATKMFCLYKNGKYQNSVGARSVLEENTISRTFMGRVLVLGGGMGHFLYLTALNPNVSEIILLDDRDDSLALLDSVVIPQIPFREKIAIVKADPCEFVKQMSDRTFDYIYVDHTVTQNLSSVYLFMLGKFLGFQHTRFAFESEEDLQYSYRNILMAKLMEEASKQNWVSHEPIDRNKMTSAVIHELEFMDQLLEYVTIQSPEDLDRLLDPENLFLSSSQNR